MKAYLYCTKAKPYMIDDGIGLNGFVCFECEINKVEEIKQTESGFMYTKTQGEYQLCRKACLTSNELEKYCPRYALYLENVKKIDKPFPISHAPQNMCYMMTMNGELCVLISIQPQHLANIANGLKDIEVRKSILNELKEMIKCRP